MFNSEQKERYIEWARNNIYEEPSIELLIRIFESTAFEEEMVFSKDVSEFNDEEVYDLLVNFNSKSRARLQSTCIYLSKYYEWCKHIEHIPLPLDNPFDKRIIDKFIDQVIPKTDLNDKYFTKEVFEDYKNCVPDITNKYIMECFYRGIRGEEFKDIIFSRMNDFDIENKTIKLCSGRIVSVDNYFIKLAKLADSSTHYFKDGIPIELSNPKIYEYSESEYILKSCGANRKSDFVSKAVINERLRTIKKQTENEFMSATTLYKNGMINYIKEKYNFKGKDFKLAVMDTSNDIETQEYIQQFGSNMNIRMFRMEIKDYLHLL